MAEEQQLSNIRQEYNTATTGLNMDQTLNQINPGTLTYALNATVENFDASSVNYQNEPGNELCVSFPDGFSLIGTHFIQERNKHIFFLSNVSTGESEIGYMENNDCIYMFTDGFTDQFGGEKNKKLKKSNFKELLSTIYEMDLEEQEAFLEYSFNNWKQDVDQTDDVLVIGLKI